MEQVKMLNAVTMAEALEEASKKIVENSGKSIMSGVKALDDKTLGWAPGELCVVGGRIDTGKTAFVLTCIANMVRQRIPIALFANERTVNPRFLSRVVSNLKGEDMLFFEEDIKKQLSECNLRNIPLYMCFCSDMSMEYIRHNIRELVAKNNIKCVFIETLQSIFDAECMGYSNETMSRVCYELKQLALDINIPIVVTSEFNRYEEGREGWEGRKPQIADLDSNATLERVADTVLLMYRPECYNIFCDEYGDSLRGMMNIFIARKRNYPIGDVWVCFNSKKCSIENISESELARRKSLRIEFAEDDKNKSFFSKIKNFMEQDTIND